VLVWALQHWHTALASTSLVCDDQMLRAILAKGARQLLLDCRETLRKVATLLPFALFLITPFFRFNTHMDPGRDLVPDWLHIHS
jgi:hypothetical protein